ncbi:MAG: DUF342 domain-containing protein [Planctomycetota bacterium]|nr:MAG: DUF342 domain-containing protein [Planctomycetota bacterium]
MSASMPQFIGPYRIIAALGSGGMATVYRGIHRNGGAERAIKVMQDVGHPQAKQRFLAEARALQTIDHPNVIRCYHVEEADEDLYMVLELVEGGDVKALMRKNGAQLPEAQALGIARDVARGLEALEEAGIIHRDIKPENIFVTRQGVAKLADFGVLRQSNNPQQLTQEGAPIGTVAYMSPEQASGGAELDMRSDIYSLGATLYAMLTGEQPFTGPSPMITLLKVVSDPFPDIIRKRKDLSGATRQCISKATRKEAADRFQHAAELREVLSGLIEHIQLGGAQDDGPVAHTTAPKKRPRATPAPPARSAPSNGKALLENLDPEGLQRVLRRVRVADNGLSAWINLAPDTRFPSELLKAVLQHREVCFGLIEAAIMDASRPRPSPRRLVVAHGDRPSPGCGGRDIYGNNIPPLQVAASVLVSDDCFQAWLLTEPGAYPNRKQAQLALIEAGVRFGIDKEALRLAWNEAAPMDGRRLVASGVRMQPGRAAGFCVQLDFADNLKEAQRNLQPVAQGDLLAVWEDAVTGVQGMDVCGNPVPVPAVATVTPEQQSGEGTEIARDRSGRLILRAIRDGHVQRRVDGVIRVVKVHEIPGDLSADDAAVVSDEVVVVRGTVRQGAQIHCSSDVVIMGNLEDAHIDAGGSIEIHGDILPGEQPVVGIETMEVHGDVQRKVVAGNLRIEGTVEHCQLVATGDISMHRVVGGSVTAGGSVRVDYAGDALGTTTELWAGRNVPYDEQAHMARLAEHRLSVERKKVLAECQELRQEYEQQQQRGVRLEGALDAQVQQRHQAMLERLQQRWQQAEHSREHSREKLAKQRQLLRDMSGITHNADCQVQVAVLAKSGVVARIADADPTRLESDRHRLRVALHD